MTVESAQPEATEAASKPLEPEFAGGALPVLGHSWKMARDPVGFFTRLRDHGDIVRIRLGPKTVYAVNSPEHTGALGLSPDFGIGGPLWDTMEVLLGKGVVTSNGARHRRQRRTIQPPLRMDAIQRYESVMVEEARALAERWESKDTVDVTAEAFRTSVRIMARCLLRTENIDELANRLNAALNIVITRMFRRMCLSFGPFYRLPLPSTANSTARWPKCTDWPTNSSPSAAASPWRATICCRPCSRRRTRMASRSASKSCTIRSFRFSRQAPRRPGSS